MKVILQQDVRGQGKKGQLIEVAEGYARNFLLPRKLAVPAVTSKEVSDALSAQHGIELAKQKIVMDEPIKAYGSYELKAKLGFEVSGTIYVMVVEEK